MSNNVIIAITIIIIIIIIIITTTIIIITFIIIIIIIIILIILIVTLLHKAAYLPAQQKGMKQGISRRARTQIGFQPSSLFKYRLIHYLNSNPFLSQSGGFSEINRVDDEVQVNCISVDSPISLRLWIETRVSGAISRYCPCFSLLLFDSLPCKVN